SPISNEKDGFASYDHDELRAYLQRLLDDPAYAHETGARGREMVAETFSMAKFVAQWREAIFAAADKKPGAATPSVQAQRHGVPFLLTYIASPHTTGRYIQEAIQGEHSVVSCGQQVPDSILMQWGFSRPIPDYPKHDFVVNDDSTSKEILAKAAIDHSPALFLWVDSGQPSIETGLAELALPKAAWFIDTHISTTHRIEIARHFDFVYLAQRGQIQEFLDAGIKHVRWMPLGCSPELHTAKRGALNYDVAFVGSVASTSGNNRQHFITRVKEAFPNHFVEQCWPHEMAAAYTRSRIVVNRCLNNDVNMRVFEAMAAGALLITDDADGLDELFENGRDLIVYHNDDEAIALIEHYLADDEARERIARAGRERVLKEHTYACRIQTMLRDIEAVTGTLAVPLPHHEAKEVEGYYVHPRRELLPAIPVSARRILDVGCGAGALGKMLKEERGTEEVCGIEFMEDAYRRASKVLDRVFLGNIEEMNLPFEEGYFDCIVCADVLEHLVQPEAVLRKLDRVLAPHGVIVISIPNARYFEVLYMLSEGCWTYREQGIMDATHLRFYTRTDFIKMIEAAGMRAADVIALNVRPASALPRNDDGSVLVGNMTIPNVSDADHEEFLTFQHLGIACKATWDCLKTANRAMEAGEYDMALTLALDAVGVDEIEQLHIVARAYARLGNLQQAAGADKMLVEKTEAPPIRGDYGILLVAMNESQRAKPLLEKALTADDSLDRVEGALGLVAMQNG
ncbi:MAG: glycosyltransferase, partial [Candidatus Hydrogenedentes bacterium]|nr:glycosyltransferase [Candidatus Hydrogenedentota bacterium]